MTDVKKFSQDVPACPTNVSHAAVDDHAVPDLEDHIIDLNSAVAALHHIPMLDSPAGLYLISRVAAHAEGIRRAFYHLPPLAAD